ncbi:MAG: hypothetical protein ACREI3_08965 [Nitrospirales bacterium]
MGHAYTPGLTVTEQTVVRKRRLLPIPGEVLVKVGDRPKAEAVVARAQLPGKVHVLNVANQLGVSADEVTDYLVKREGEPLAVDDVIAESKPLITWFKTVIRSPLTGTVESVSTVTGQVQLREPPRLLDLLAYVDGRIIEVHPNQGVTIEASCTMVQGIFGIGGETWGELVMGVKTPDDPLTPNHLAPAMAGKIVVGGAFLNMDTMAKARQIGVAGLVVGGVHDKDLREVLGYDLGVAITGTERVGFTLVITEGFGSIPMAARTFQLLARHAGQRASMSGATQIRAGVIRPELLIPRGRGGAGEGASDDSPAAERSGIQLGDQVRIIRDPLFGRIGRVVGLPPGLQAIETESQVRVIEVDFGNGVTAVIPRANVEIIEG